MRLHQASIEAQAEEAERIAAALEAADAPAAMAVTLFERGPGQVEVTALYHEPPTATVLTTLLQDAVAEFRTLSSLRIAPVAEADWVRLSQGMRGPVRAGRFLIHGSHSPAARNRCSIEIDASTAFGTAHHASTRGCLLALDALLKRTRPARIADIGTGTGILAIAAAKALHMRVLASDNDPVAVRIAAENARKNGVGGLVRVVEADGLAHPWLRGPFDLLLANLLLNPLLELAPAFARAVAGGGFCVLSGLTEGQRACVEARFRAAGFTLVSRILLDGWASLLMRRRMLKRRAPVD
jgi:ribosomal protein L11 methyltransferase